MDREQKVERRRRIVRIASIGVFLILLTAVTILVWPYAKEMGTDSGREELMKMFEKFDTFWSIVIFVGIQALQVIIAIIPPIQIVGGMMFGWFFGAILSFAGVMLGTFMIFMLVRIIGKPIVEAFVDSKNLERFEFLQDEDKLVGILIILYVIPGVPKDVLSYIVPLTKVSRRDFFLYVMPFRIPAVVLSTVFGQSVVTGSYVLAFILIGVFVLTAILGIVFRNKIFEKFENRNRKDET